jgi:hypothetical protein
MVAIKRCIADRAESASAANSEAASPRSFAAMALVTLVKRADRAPAIARVQANACATSVAFRTAPASNAATTAAAEPVAQAAVSGFSARRASASPSSRAAMGPATTPRGKPARRAPQTALARGAGVSRTRAACEAAAQTSVAMTAVAVPAGPAQAPARSASMASAASKRSAVMTSVSRPRIAPIAPATAPARVPPCAPSAAAAARPNAPAKNAATTVAAVYATDAPRSTCAARTSTVA